VEEEYLNIIMAEDSSSRTYKSPAAAVEAARKLWLSATCQLELDEVERLYRWALSTKKKRSDGDGEKIINNEERCDGPSKKRIKQSLTNDGGGCGLTREQFNQAGEKYGLLLCQSGRCHKAKKGLISMGFTCRLAKQVLDYPSDDDYCKSNRADDTNTSDICEQKLKNKQLSSSPCCQIIDGFLSESESEQLRMVFESPTSSYWTDHQYTVEPPSPYFSYVISLDQIHENENDGNKQQFGFIGQLIQKIVSCPLLNNRFPRLQSNAKFIELWAHNRPHASGHQMHFDSDDEGRGGVRNPIISTILYITEGAGGPSLVTNQKVTDSRVATQGWLAHPRSQRLVVFDGRYLHGVVPGKGVREGRRVTLMMAFWDDIRIRDGDGPGSTRPFPTSAISDTSSWASQLVIPLPGNSNNISYESCVETDPIQLDTIYETLNGKPWKRGMGMPSYDEVFQGF
jgi:hypothetical protein